MQLVCAQRIDCGDGILLASDLFCVGVTKPSKIQFAVANPSWVGWGPRMPGAKLSLQREDAQDLTHLSV